MSCVSRRSALLALLAVPLLPASAGAGSAKELAWSDLIPDGGGVAYKALRELGVVQHGEMSTGFEQPVSAQLNRAFDGQRVRLPGYVVPLSYEGTGTTAFLLVPYVGACIHVPPPPPNQIVFVTTEEPYVLGGLFEPVRVTGVFDSRAAETELAEVGYSIAADQVEPYPE
jgi:hypothetical protein